MKPVYRVIWLIARVSLRFFYPVRWRHRERVPQGRVILSGNHISYMDPIVIALSLPFPVHFMAKSELFEGSKFVAWLLPRVHAFPVRRGVADRESIARASELLKHEMAVGIFPEGTRNQDGLAQAQDGAAFLAMRTNAPVVPVGIAGTDKIRLGDSKRIHFPRITLVYGEPVVPSEYEGGRRERMQAMTSDIMERIESARKEAERG
ncbi:MAG: lysophospholipid acyltransferase family protein [Actinomycetota bacterium]|jgi:1-acyl-sn-glycerol-3-phosphate acyltransferase|nr:lysophospholipid acyltransferase family protein [Actinomycetota bacterium]